MRSVQSTVIALLIASRAACAETTFNLTQGVSPISRDVYQLHMIVFWICVAIGVVVFGAMAYSIIYHRKSRGVKPAQFHSHLWLEITWTIIPVLILIAMAIPATKVLLRMNNYDKNDITIKITGYQWKWHYEYLEAGVSFFSNLSTPLDQRQNLAPKSKNYLREVDRPMVVPIHKKIRFLITSNDVNHAWWVPDLAVKKDAVGGFINEAWTIINKPGVYYGQCAELCGINHAFMPIVVIATTEAAYNDWIAQQKGQPTSGKSDLSMITSIATPSTTASSTGATATALPEDMASVMARGQTVYEATCAVCHQPNGEGVPPTFPAMKGSPVAIGPIPHHMDQVLNGKPGTAMQAFRDQLTDQQIADVITYERNAWGNNKGDIIKPEDIKARR